MTHARLSASAAHRWIPCPGSVQLIETLQKEKKIPPQKSSAHAAEGTAAHFLAELCLVELVHHGVWDASANEYLEDTILVDPDGNNTELKAKKGKTPKGILEFPVTKEMAKAVDVYVQHVRGVLESMGASSKGIPDDIRVELEVDIDVSHLNCKALGGMCDTRIVQEFGDLHVIDYKHGVGVPVDPENNPQIMLYALGSNIMANDFPERVHLTIVQPRCPYVPDVQTWTVTPLELRAWVANSLLPAAKEALGDDPSFQAGEKQCHWCKARAHCPETEKLSLAVAQQEFALDPEEAVRGLSDDKFLELFSKVGVLRQVAAALEDRALYELQSGKELPGFKLVEKRTQRRWSPDAEQVLKENKVPEKVMYDKKLVSFTKLEKMKKYKELVASLVEKPEGKVEVARDTDKRPALPSSVELDFGPREEDDE